MKYFSTFSGIGGFELGIGEKGECIGFSEIDKYATQIYLKHFPEHKAYGNITTINAATLPDFDFLCGGFPCQSFSIAGKRKGFDDTRGTLFFELARILQAKRPSNFLFENVKGLLSHDNGITFKTIIFALTELGYDCQWQVLNSKNFGVAQNRERVFIIGHLREEPRPEVFPIRQNNTEDIILPTLTARYYGGQANGGYIGNVTPAIRASSYKRGDNDTIVGTYRTHKDGNGFRVMQDGNSPTIPARAREDGSGQPVIAVPLKFLERNQKNYQGEYSFTIDTANTGGIMQEMKVRRLTPIECERLQGFPDGWTEYGVVRSPQDENNSYWDDIKISDSQRYKCLGNAVTVNVIKAIIERLF